MSRWRSEWPWLALLLAVTAPVALAGASQREEQPSLELLEFLGEWSAGEDEGWFDPLQMLGDGAADERDHDDDD